MNKKEWQVAYRQYRIARNLAEQYTFPAPSFPLPEKCGWFVRHRCIVTNYTTGNIFSVREWKAPVESSDWLSGDSLQNRFIGHYLLIGEVIDA